MEADSVLAWAAIYGQLSQNFSPWLPWRGITGYDFMRNPGVYLFAELADDTVSPSVVDPAIVYIGETTRQTLLTRFIQFEEAARTGCSNRHFGGQKYHLRTNGELVAEGCRLLPDEFYISVMPIDVEEPERSAYIRYTERAALWYFVRANNRYPRCNTM